MVLLSDETALSRRSSYRRRGSTVQFEYHIQDESDVLTIKQTVEAGTALFYDGLVLTAIDIDPEESADNDLWKVAVTYGDPDSKQNEERPETGDSEFSFDTAGGTEHIELALSPNVGYTKPAGPARPDVKNIIGLSKDGNGVQVEGVDILVPHMKFRETHWLPASKVDPAYVNTLSGVTGTTNKQQFRTYDVGEVLFTGASGKKRGRGDWQVTFNFEVSKNKQNFQVGDIQIAWKPGWEYIWVMYEDVIDASQLIKRPLHAFVCQVYSQGDFAKIGIGLT